ncbi:MAG: hypothetical protein ACREXR_11740 [Gammaproteobacteria bacterium]
MKAREAAAEAARRRGERVDPPRRDAAYVEQLATARYWLGLLWLRPEHRSAPSQRRESKDGL